MLSKTPRIPPVGLFEQLKPLENDGEIYVCVGDIDHWGTVVLDVQMEVKEIGKVNQGISTSTIVKQYYSWNVCVNFKRNSAACVSTNKLKGIIRFP